ncbi:MAG TPA: 1,4-alpha-glucan branching protein domain-containing protein [Mycobacteriales bacterium]|nr:1,4-alpha-glucan branching protein domain-containing protein [Mycobacteriales bacterium]
MTPPAGTFCLVLHTHLPWVAHAGAWPVGEEWLHQAFTGSWRRVLALLDRLAEAGTRDALTLGVTPVVAAMLDDPYCLRELHTWAGGWQLRAAGLAARREPHLRELATYEFRAATECLADLEGRWLTGGLSSVLRPLLDASVVELLGGPATHPFLPLLDPRVAAAQLAVGLDDARLRYGRAPAGIWAPECGYAPGLERLYASAGVERFVVDGPALHGDTAAARPVGDSGVLCVGRDLDVTYRVWSPRAGYPGAPDYRDFHTFDHASGFRPARVTARHLPPEAKRPWERDRAAAAVRRDAADFVDAVRRRLRDLHDRDGRPGLVVACYDTELFGHWWHEGPQWLAAVLRALPLAGIRVTTLRGAVEAGHVGPPVRLGPSSWGTGKDWRVWTGPAAQDLTLSAKGVQARLLSIVDGNRAVARDPVLDQLAREAFLALSSDWVFMVTKDSAAAYARDRAAAHAGRVHALADLLDSGDRRAALALTERLRLLDGPFGHLDARSV